MILKNISKILFFCWFLRIWFLENFWFFWWTINIYKKMKKLKNFMKWNLLETFQFCIFVAIICYLINRFFFFSGSISIVQLFNFHWIYLDFLIFSFFYCLLGEFFRIADFWSFKKIIKIILTRILHSIRGISEINEW